MNHGIYDIRFTDRAGNISEKQIKILDVSMLKAGDYIKYDTGVTSVGENGVVMFRVLYPVNSKYGLQIISDKNVGGNISLGGSTWEEGKIAYNGAIEKLNSEAEKYVNLTYAYDGRCVGSIPTARNGMFTDKNKLKDSTEKILSNIGTVSISETWTMPAGWTSRNTGCCDRDINYAIDQAALKGAGIYTTGEDYWLASRILNPTSSYLAFHVQYVVAGGVGGGHCVCVVEQDGGTDGRLLTNGLRPCISLKSRTIKIIDGDGKEQNPYIIGI